MANKEAAAYVSVTIVLLILPLIISYHMYSHTSLLKNAKVQNLDYVSVLFSVNQQPIQTVLYLMVTDKGSRHLI